MSILCLVLFFIGMKADACAASSGEMISSAEAPALSDLFTQACLQDDLDGARTYQAGYAQADPLLLHRACTACRFSTIRFLIEECNINLTTQDQDGKQALHISCARTGQKGKKIIRYLITKNVDLSTLDEHGNTCLHYACASGNLGLIRFLAFKQYISIYQRNHSNLRPIDYLKHEYSSDVIAHFKKKFRQKEMRRGS